MCYESFRNIVKKIVKGVAISVAEQGRNKILQRFFWILNFKCKQTLVIDLVGLNSINYFWSLNYTFQTPTFIYGI